MMEAEIDPSTEPMVVDSSSDCGPLGKALEVQAVSGTLDSGQFISSSGASMHHSHTKPQQFSCMEALTAQRSKEDLEVIEVKCLLNNVDGNKSHRLRCRMISRFVSISLKRDGRYNICFFYLVCDFTNNLIKHLFPYLLGDLITWINNNSVLWLKNDVRLDGREQHCDWLQRTYTNDPPRQINLLQTDKLDTAVLVD